MSTEATKTLDKGKGLPYLDHVMKNQNTTQKSKNQPRVLPIEGMTKQSKYGYTLYAGRRLDRNGKTTIVWMSIPE